VVGRVVHHGEDPVEPGELDESLDLQPHPWAAMNMRVAPRFTQLVVSSWGDTTQF
jgi:hypothetical protein